MLYIAVFLVVLIILVLLFAIKIKAALEYERNEKEEWLKLAFYTKSNIFRYEYEVPLLKKEDEKTKFKLVKGQSREMRGGTAENESLMPYDIVKKYISFRTYLKDHGDVIEDIRNYLNNRDIHVEVNIKLRQGTGDAAQTGFICGLLWTAAGILLNWLSKYLKVLKNEIRISPCFNKSVFEAEASCIFHVRLVHIIVVLKKIYLMKYTMKIKRKKMTGGEFSG